MYNAFTVPQRCNIIKPSHCRITKLRSHIRTYVERNYVEKCSYIFKIEIVLCFSNKVTYVCRSQV